MGAMGSRKGTEGPLTAANIEKDKLEKILPRESNNLDGASEKLFVVANCGLENAKKDLPAKTPHGVEKVENQVGKCTQSAHTVNNEIVDKIDLENIVKGAEDSVEKESNTPNRASLRQRHRRESISEKPVEMPSTKAVIVKEKLPPVERPINWFEGDLVWALVSGHPLWPCMVSCDPEAKSHTKMKGTGTSSTRTYHVQFFGDSPEHAWINESRIFKFINGNEYKNLVQSIAKRIPKRPPKVEISARFLQNWNAAIKEIATAIPITSQKRKEKFEFVYVNNYPRKRQFMEPLGPKRTDGDLASDKLIKHTGMLKGTVSSSACRKEKASDQEVHDANGLCVNTSLFSVDDTLDFVVKKYTASPGLNKLAKGLLGTSSKESESKKFYACMTCDNVYTSVADMHKHCKEMHPESGKIPKTLNADFLDMKDVDGDAINSNTLCPFCGKMFANKRSLGQHRRFTHPEDVLPPINKASVVPEMAIPKMPKNLIAIPVPLNKAKPEPTVTTPRLKCRPLLSSLGKKDPVCVICEENGDVITCSADCYRSFHVKCLENFSVSDPFVCKDCKSGSHLCIICKKSALKNVDGLGELKRCVVALCGRYFHSTCLQILKLKITAAGCDKAPSGGPSTRCPSHSCSTCMSKAVVEATRGDETHNVKPSNRTRLFKCIRCPTAYHVGDDCLAAGSVLLGGLNIVCPNHFKPVKTLNHHHPVHISWCFVCSKGGELICCAACPAAFHAQCINLDKTPDGDWHCLDCLSGVRPLYDDIVWVKLGTYRWWPGQITHPNDIPDNIARLNHGPGEFVVRFFGSNDYFWLSKCRVFLYQDGDNGATNRHCSRGISGVFKKALQEAEETFRAVTATRQLQEEVKIAVNGKKPLPYKHIRCNKPVGNVQIFTAVLSEMAKCSCRRTDPNPCGVESECLNRMLLYECHPAVCPAGDRCQNQRFQKCEYPATEVFKTTWGGWGLKTKAFIKKGTFVNEYVGELVDEEECRRRIERAHEKNVTNFYMLTIDKDRIIDAGPKGNYSRFMNHCCNPNCETQKWSVNGDTRVGLFAVRDVMVGEELTFNYNLDCLGNDKTKCMCGSENCSGFIGVRPKAQMDGVKRERKKKRKPRRLENLPQHDDFCFRCRHTGTLVCCDFKGCLRAFCMDCLHIDKPPYGKWECPCHHCDWCGRRAQYFCSFCPNSFCGSHVDNQLQPSIPNKFDTCKDHDPLKAEFEMAQVVAMVNDLMNMPLDEQKKVVPPVKASGNVESGQEDENVGSAKIVGQKRKQKPVGSTRAKRVK